jgi:hypothetical protein
MVGLYCATLIVGKNRIEPNIKTIAIGETAARLSIGFFSAILRSCRLFFQKFFPNLDH